MWQAMQLMKVSLIIGNANSGKTQTVNDMAQFMGRILGYMIEITRLLLSIYSDSQNENTRCKAKPNIHDFKDSETKIIFFREFYSINLYETINNLCFMNLYITINIIF